MGNKADSDPRLRRSRSSVLIKQISTEQTSPANTRQREVAAPDKEAQGPLGTEELCR